MMRQPSRLAFLVLIVLLGSGCTAALDRPPVVVPDKELLQLTGGVAVDSLAVMSVAAVGKTSTRKGFRVERNLSATLAEQIDRTVMDLLAARGLRVNHPSRLPAPGYFDSVTHFDEIGINEYGGGGIGGGYFGRMKIPAFYCMDDSTLRGPTTQEAWLDVLGGFGGLRRGHTQATTIHHPDRLRESLCADALLVVVARVEHVTSGAQVKQAVGYTALTLGMFPYYKSSSCVVHAYLLDLDRGVFRWASACRVNGADSLAVRTACSEVFRRWAKN